MIDSIDHIVLTTKDVKACLYFYCNILGMEYKINIIDNQKRISLKFGNQKINLHTESKPYLPHAKNPISGSVDVCFLSSIELVKWINIFNKNNISIEIGPVKTEGAKGPIVSIYVRDPDSNLIEIANKIK